MEINMDSIRVEKIVQNIIHLLFGSVGRFLILLGVLLLIAGYTLANGMIAGHLGIYGVSVLVLGLFIRLIWFVRD
jgi:type IV secretory pathway VirB2 component (pilin)